MRMMLRVRIPVEAGNVAFTDGSLGKGIQQAIDTLKPEAAYFFPDEVLKQQIAEVALRRAQLLN